MFKAFIKKQENGLYSVIDHNIYTHFEDETTCVRAFDMTKDKAQRLTDELNTHLYQNGMIHHGSLAEFT